MHRSLHRFSEPLSNPVTPTVSSIRRPVAVAAWHRPRRRSAAGHRGTPPGAPAAETPKRRRGTADAPGARIASDAGDRGTTSERKWRTGLGGWSAGGEAAEMTGCDPSAGDDRFERLRNVRESDLQEPGRFGSRLVPELADRAVLVGCVLLVADGRYGRGAGQHQRQEDDPGAPTGTTCLEPRVHGFSLGHPLSTLAEIARDGKRSLGTALEPAPTASGPERTRLTPACFCCSIVGWRR